MATIGYLVPYEVAIHAGDIKSGKALTNIVYVKTGLQTAGPPAYGDPIAGGGSTTTLLNSVATLWEGTIVPLLSANYQLVDYTMRSIIGKSFKTPMLPISALIPGTPVVINMGSPHGLATGDSVSLSGVTTPASINGVWGIVVTGPYSFSLAGSSSATLWSGDGFVQALKGASGYLYGDGDLKTSSAVGGVAGDACPLFNSFSVRRISQAASRHFRSRLSLGPVPEASQSNGKITSGAATAWATALASIVSSAGLINGGTDTPGSGYSLFGAVSKQIALTQATPFTKSSPWFSFTTNYALRPNCGSMLRRKVKLGAPIS